MRRARLAALAAIGATLIIVLLALLRGINGPGAGGPVGTDFASFYAAGQAALAGKPTAPYDPGAHYAREQALFGAATPFYAWQYPPPFLLLVTPLATLPYLPALLVWQAASLFLYVVAIVAIARRWLPKPLAEDKAVGQLAVLLALGYPAVFINLGHGQNGFLSAALIGGGLALLPRRPVVAGVLFGLLGYKPQLCLMLPIALVAASAWRAIGASVLTVVALFILTSLAFGPEVWSAFLGSTGYARTALLEAAHVDWYKFQTVFAAVRLWGGSLTAAYAMQAIATLAAAGATGWLWRRGEAYPTRAAALSLGTILATPFAFDYDLMVLAPGIAFLACSQSAGGTLPFARSAMALLWAIPLVARAIAGTVALPIGILSVAAVFVLVIILHVRISKRQSAGASINQSDEKPASL